MSAPRRQPAPRRRTAELAPRRAPLAAIGLLARIDPTRTVENLPPLEPGESLAPGVPLPRWRWRLVLARTRAELVLRRTGRRLGTALDLMLEAVGAIGAAIAGGPW